MKLKRMLRDTECEDTIRTGAAKKRVQWWA
jgi:hypothetical protein